jgi:methylglutaconyl-CoA hydratase
MHKLTEHHSVTQPTVALTIDHPQVATLWLNRPDKHNAFDDAMIAQLTQACEQVACNPELRVLILASKGRNFSAGADLGWMQRMAEYSYEENLRDAKALAKLLETLNTLPQATIARVQGAVFGGAVGLVSCCDMAVATSAARFCLSEVKLGLVPATISPYVIAAIGPRAARRYFTTAETFSANSAHQLGLVSELAEEEDLDATIEQWITAILANGPRAVNAAKQLVAQVSGKPIDRPLIDSTCELIANIRVSTEGQEGLQAFLQKRRPNWNGE